MTTYKGFIYKLESIEPKHTPEIFKYLNSQITVRGKYAHGNTISEDDTTKRVLALSAKFELDGNGWPKDPNLYMYGGFVVYDAKDNSFLGMCSLEESDKTKYNVEMSYLNRPDARNSTFNQNALQQYEIKESERLKKPYTGLGTAEVYAMIQYAKYLKEYKYQINGEDLEFVGATARVDNPGSWKAAAKAGMVAYDIDQNLNHSEDVRYQLRAKI
jgi:hypothetical protein